MMPRKQTRHAGGCRHPRLFLCRVILGCLIALPALAQTPDLTITSPWMRYLLPTLPAAGYLTVHNNTATPDTLTSAASPACGTLMLHESLDNSGMSVMIMAPTITIPAGGSVSFAPGGYHLMCMQPRMKLGDKIDVTLNFRSGASVSTTMPVYGATGAP